jgi:hypothetical protein
MIFPNKFWGMNLIRGLPRVVTFRVPLPFDEVLEPSSLAMTLMVYHMFHFIFFFPINKVRWWLGEVGTMCCRLMIG